MIWAFDVMYISQLLDAFGHKSNISLVFDFMETDLEVRQFLTFWLIVCLSVSPLE